MDADNELPAGLQQRCTPGARIVSVGSGRWRLQVPPSQGYCLAQLDDYGGRLRKDLPWKAPCELRLRARAASAEIPGTWGFGLWNDPFGMGMGISERVLRLPALPNTAWFFHASPPNHLTLRDDLPAQGWLASTFRSPLWPPGLLALGSPGLVLLALRPTARSLRRFARHIVQQDSRRLVLDPSEWHSYALEWRPEAVRFKVDDFAVFETPVTPLGCLGVVIWIDNQYLSFTRDGRLRFGTLETPQEYWIEIGDLQIEGKAGD